MEGVRERQHLPLRRVKLADSLAIENSRPKRVASLVEELVRAYVALDLGGVLCALEVREAKAKGVVDGAPASQKQGHDEGGDPDEELRLESWLGL